MSSSKVLLQCLHTSVNFSETLSYAKHTSTPMCQLTFIVESIIKTTWALTWRRLFWIQKRKAEAGGMGQGVKWTSAWTWAARLNYHPLVVCQWQKLTPHSSEARKSKPRPADLGQGRAWVLLCSRCSFSVSFMVKGRSVPVCPPRRLTHAKTQKSSWVIPPSPPLALPHPFPRGSQGSRT